MDKISFPVSRFKPEYLQHIWDRIALFRTKKDERLLQDFDLFSEENIEQISEIEIELNDVFESLSAKYLVELIDESDFIGEKSINHTCGLGCPRLLRTINEISPKYQEWSTTFLS